MKLKIDKNNMLEIFYNSSEKEKKIFIASMGMGALNTPQIDWLTSVDYIKKYFFDDKNEDLNEFIDSIEVEYKHLSFIVLTFLAKYYLNLNKLESPLEAELIEEKREENIKYFILNKYKNKGNKKHTRRIAEIDFSNGDITYGQERKKYRINSKEIINSNIIQNLYLKSK